MKKRPILIILSAAMILSACGKSATSTAQDTGTAIDNSCPQGFIGDYNNLGDEANSLHKTLANKSSTDLEIEDALNYIVNVCSHFYDLHQNVSCTATNDRTGKVEQIQSDDFKNDCSKANQELDQWVADHQAASIPTPTPTPVPIVIHAVADEATITSVENSPLALAILNSALIQSTQKKSLVFLNGKPAASSDVLSGSTTCGVYGLNAESWTKIPDGTKFASFEQTQAVGNGGERTLNVQLADEAGETFIAVACSKITSEPFTFKDIRDSLKGIVEIGVK